MFHRLTKPCGVFVACALLSLACGGVSMKGLGNSDASGAAGSGAAGSGAAGSGTAGSGTSGSGAAGSGGSGSGPSDAAVDLARIGGGGSNGGASGDSGGTGGVSTSGGAGGGGSAGANGSGGTGNDAGVADAGRSDATTSDGATGKDACSPTAPVGTDLKRDPAVNACGNGVCEYKTSYCCAPRSSTAPACQQSPYGSDKSACVAKGALPITCDEKAKCQHSTVCCGVKATPDAELQMITCVEKVNCQSPDLVICGSDLDCYLGQICVPRMIYGQRMGVCETAPPLCQ